MEDHEKCTMQPVLNADKNAKFHLSPTQTGLYTAENVTQNEDPREETDTKPQASICSYSNPFLLSIFSFNFITIF
jgi:hypothetical protein